MKVKMPQAIGKFGFKASDLARHKLFEHFGRPSVPWKFAKPVGSEVAAHCIVGGERLWGANTGPGSIRRVYSIDKSPARRSCWKDGGGGGRCCGRGLHAQQRVCELSVS